MAEKWISNELAISIRGAVEDWLDEGDEFDGISLESIRTRIKQLIAEAHAECETYLAVQAAEKQGDTSFDCIIKFLNDPDLVMYIDTRAKMDRESAEQNKGPDITDTFD